MLNTDEILFRCSSAGHLMTDPKKKSESLSECTKTHLVDVYVSKMYNRFREINAKQLDKGNDTEEDSITVVSRLTGKLFKKNEDHLSNEFIKGTPDLFTGESIYNAETIRDTKSSWDAYSFFRAKAKPLDPMYYWQGMGYMWLTGAKSCSIDYCLNNTPFNLVMKELNKESYNYPEADTPAWVELQIIANHVYDEKTFKEYIDRRGISVFDQYAQAVRDGFVEIPLKERHFSFEFPRSSVDIERLKHKIIECRKYMATQLFKQPLKKVA
jgi:hypothetical protein